LKRRSVIIGFTLILGLLVGIYIFADNNIVERSSPYFGMMATYESYEEHRDASNLVVIGELAGVPKNVLTPFGSANQYPDGHHLSKIKISEVLKGNEELNGKVIDVREPYYTVEKGILPGVVENYYGDYTKIEKGYKYLLFLSWEEDWGQYGVSSAHEGKFNIDGKDKVEQEIAQINEKVKKLREDIFSHPDISEYKE